MTPEPTPTPGSSTMPMFRMIGLIAFVAGAFALIFGIVRFNSLVSVALRETKNNDLLLWITLVGGALLTLYGAVTVFGGYNFAQTLRTGRPKSLAVASLICGVCGVFIFPLAIVGLVLGHTARWRIRNDRTLPGGGLALLALFVCYIPLAWLAFILSIILSNLFILPLFQH